MFRLIQLWLHLASDKEINERLAQASRSVPSFKFLGLAYQIASRMSSSQTGTQFQSGFQVPASTSLQPSPDSACLQSAVNKTPGSNVDLRKSFPRSQACPPKKVSFSAGSAAFWQLIAFLRMEARLHPTAGLCCGPAAGVAVTASWWRPALTKSSFLFGWGLPSFRDQ